MQKILITDSNLQAVSAPTCTAVIFMPNPLFHSHQYRRCFDKPAADMAEEAMVSWVI